MQNNEERFIGIEINLANQEKMLDEMNDAIIEQGKKIEQLIKQNRYLLSLMKEEGVKPQEEETPPPHY